MNTSIPSTKSASKKRFLDAADRIGNLLVRDAIWCGDTCNWLIWTKESVNGALQNVYRAAPGSIYLGTAGLGLFLSYLAVATDDAQQLATARAAAKQIAQSLSRFEEQEIGFFTGSLGAALALIHIGNVLGDKESVHAGLKFCDAFIRWPAGPSECDLLSGKAGAVLALTLLGERHHRPSLLDHAAKLADALLATAEVKPHGRSWPSSSPRSANLLGLSHGTTGVILALLELNQHRPDSRYAAAAQAALQYERSLFDASQTNWPDFRLMPNSPVTAPSFPVAWCHGSTGMGLARLRLYELLPQDPLLLAEIDASMQNAVRVVNMPISLETSDFTPCHGLTGHGEFLLMAGVAFQRDDAIAAAERIGDVGIEVFGKPDLPWPCGIPNCGESYSFMTGLAGIGYYFLRLFNSETHPSVLLPSRRLA